MRANTNIALKERNALTLKDLRGVDYTSSPLDVSSNRAVEMCNLYCDNGQLRKRHGWDQTHKLSDRINGLWSYKDNTHECLIVHAGTNLYRIINGNEELLMEELTDTRSQAFFNKGKLYIIGVGDYLVYGTWDDALYKVRSVVECEDLYIPTTTTGIGGNNVSHPWVGDNRDVLDAVNILNPFVRKNKLIGEKGKYYYLDETIDPKRITETIVEIEVIPAAWKEYNLSEENILTCSVKQEQDGGNYNIYARKKDDTVVDIGQVNFIGEGTLYFRDYDVEPPIAGQSNVTVTFYVAENEKRKSKTKSITKCSFGALFGIGAGDRLFLSGGSEEPDKIYFSHNNDFTYFPDINYLTQGGTVRGLTRLSDATLIAFKSISTSDDAAFSLISGGFVEKTLKTGDKYTDEVFRITGGAKGESCVSHHACASFAGDSLILSDGGVFGIVLTDNVSTNERYARERSRLINKRLCAHDLSESVGISYKNRYYLSVGDEEGSVYVADARYKVSVDDDIDGSYNYEWWHWKGVPARVWAIIDGKLCFGTNDGRVCAFNDTYADRSYEVYSEADFSIQKATNTIVFNEALCAELEKATHVHFNSPIHAIMIQNAYVENSRIIVGYETVTDFETYCEDIYSFHEGMEVLIGSPDYAGISGLVINNPYYVTDIDYGNCSFALCDKNGNIVKIADFIGGETESFEVYRSLSGKDLYIENLIASSGGLDNDSFQLKEYPEGPTIRIGAYHTVYEDEGGEYANPSVSLVRCIPVMAEWYSPPLDFGTVEASKTLLKLTVVSEAVVGGKLSVGYNTRVASKQYNVAGVGKFSLEDLNFSDLTFDTGFATSYSRKVFEKFNFLQFRFRSDNNKDCALNSITALYKINKSNIGVK